jgi:hypothetical protein
MTIVDASVIIRERWDGILASILDIFIQRKAEKHGPIRGDFK